MNLIIAGGRDFTDYKLLKDKLDFLLSKTDKEEVTILCGMARGQTYWVNDMQMRTT